MSIDLDDIERRIADGIYGDDRMTKEGRNNAFSALNEIIAEVERLRHDVADRQLQREGNIIDNMHAYEEGVAEGERRATAAVVAFLRTMQPTYLWCALLDAADTIERGEHRREAEALVAALEAAP